MVIKPETEVFLTIQSRPRKILLVEDETEIAEVLTLHLEDIGGIVTHATDGVRGLTLALQNRWDMILLDLSLPRCDGIDICQQVRTTNPTTPIVLVTARSTEGERILGLDTGADDYITKPFAISEFMARIKSLFRRIDALREAPDQEHVIVRDIVLNPDAHSVSISGKPVQLTAKEFDLLLFFSKSPGQVFKRTELLEKVWGYAHDGYMHTVNSHLHRLRAKIEIDPANPEYIRTVWGVGYKLEA